MKKIKNMLKFSRAILLGVLFSYSSTSFSEIIKTNDFQVMKNKIQNSNKNTLVIFDLDEVLIRPTDEFVFFEDPIRMDLMNKLKKRNKGLALDVLWSAIMEKVQYQILDREMPALLSALEKKGAPTIALTLAKTGAYGKINKMEDLRFNDLKQVDLSFKHTSPFKSEVIFKDFGKRSRVPMLKDGVILTDKEDKGLVLKAVLKAFNAKFKKIIFVDDRLDNLQSVQKACQELGIRFDGIHYRAIDLVSWPKLNKAKEKLRFEILEREQIWLTDKELDLRDCNMMSKTTMDARCKA